VSLPIAVFLATYAAGAVGFIVGQAAFTLLVIILFNLIVPAGWRVGLVRIEDIGVGVGISLLTSVLLWPRGARGELVAAIAGQYRALTAYLGGSFARILDPDSPDDTAARRALAVRARDRAGDAFDQFLQERGAKPLDPDTAASLLAAGAHVLLVGDLLGFASTIGYQVRNTADGATALRAQAQLTLAEFLQLADRLEHTTSGLLAGARVSDKALRHVALTCLQRWRGVPADDRSALAATIAGEWIQQLGEMTTELEAPVAQAAEAARSPWWR
jgi:uncharacterized membrane protein YccC